jgi:hypothetical protein
MGVRRGGGSAARYQKSFLKREVKTETRDIATVAGSTGEIQYNLSGSQSNASMMYDAGTGFLGAGFTSLNDITHRITLPNTAGNTGKIKAVAYTTYSSFRFKSEIQTIQNPMHLIKHMRGVTYERTDDNTAEYGFIAEEVGQVVPSVVEWEVDGGGAQGLDYTRLVPILLEGIKAQQRQLESQQKQIEHLISIVGADRE